ncbi:LysM peptidoglycan-binding domain-containing protein [Alteromonas oceanisediminis]|uniref:LysM peptidoglycan-binding domain-containing protein n=1 Tax=Alteromonas oceanisediminis TaxID=2836180 RepID=UPI001BDA3582|nr:LysM domain-containing protein [Alteromonas oceanisediminis]MBT0586653.1 LysM peptidoglycan-binding domain-containing protein [Alteromonas oceanisediminis]
MRKLNLFALWLIMLAPMCCFAQQIEVKPTAPDTYVVEQGDTLWDISSLFLNEPWLWPELWRTNTQVLNPHLIYPGDVLQLKWQDGQPYIALTRSDKRQIRLSPSASRTTKAGAIPLLAWSAIAPYLNNDLIMSVDDYDRLPHLLGNTTGDIRFISDDIVLARARGRSTDQYSVVRKQDTLYDRFGNEIGIQVRHVADAAVTDVQPESEWLVKVQQSNYEAKRGDKLFQQTVQTPEQMELVPASRKVRGEVVSNLHQRSLLGKHDVVILDLGDRDVVPGMVLGIYLQGPTIYDGDKPQYDDESHVLKSAFDDGNTITQPALKIGEAMVFKTFDKASYAMITRASELVKNGAIVGAP